jgi:predicted nuclease with RNAse H fold
MSVITCVGVDVGGARKGFHAVALRGGAYASQLVSGDVHALAHWCRHELKARVIAIDAPCRWSPDGRLRACEQELMAHGIRCFASPTRERALAHPTDYFGWMLQGETLYRALETSHPLCSGLPVTGQPCCFETFPHAITWHLRGGEATASRKRTQRRALLAGVGIELASLTSIDLVDAALCAFTAHHAATGGKCRSYGTPGTGLVIVPEPSPRPRLCAAGRAPGDRG